MEKLRKIMAVLFSVLAVAMAAALVWIALAYRQAAPVLVRPSQAAQDTAQRMLQAVQQGDYDTAGSLIWGNPDLGVDRQAETEVGKRIWEAYQSSLDYAPVGACYATASGVAQDYCVSRLDMHSVTSKLRERSRLLLEQRVEEAEDIRQVYDENNDYREDVVMEVLEEAAKQALQEDAVYVQEVFTVHLVYRGNAWWVLPEEQMIQAISGALAG